MYNLELKATGPCFPCSYEHGAQPDGLHPQLQHHVWLAGRQVTQLHQLQAEVALSGEGRYLLIENLAGVRSGGILLNLTKTK
jgi:hypothetical protein